MQVVNIKRESIPQLFESPRDAWVAQVELDGGVTLFLSRYDNEDEYLADSMFGANGYPHFAHGTGSRVTKKRAASEALGEILKEAELGAN